MNNKQQQKTPEQQAAWKASQIQITEGIYNEDVDNAVAEATEKTSDTELQLLERNPLKRSTERLDHLAKLLDTVQIAHDKINKEGGDASHAREGELKIINRMNVVSGIISRTLQKRIPVAEFKHPRW